MDVLKNHPAAGAAGRERRKGMWDKLRKNHPGLYEALEWLCVALALGAFLLALGMYLR